MKESRNYFWNRAVAILLVLVMVLGSISWQGKSEVVAAEGETQATTEELATTEETSADIEDVTTEELSTEETSSEGVSAEETSPEEVSAEETSAEEVTTEESSAEEVTTEGASSEEVSTEEFATTETTTAAHGVTGGYDLIVTDISWINASISEGTQVVFAATIKNDGDTDIPAGIVIGYQIQIDGNTDCITWCDSYSGGLKAGETITLECNGGTIGNYWRATNGIHSVMAWVDDVHRFENEVNEKNNKYTISLTIPYVPETRCPTVHIEAEEYESESGVKLRGTYDQGTDVLMSVDAGDYMIYTVNIPVEGYYRFIVRAARKDAGVSVLSLMENDSVIATVNVKKTGDWDKFSEFKGTEVFLTAGTHTFKVYANGGRYNLNWYELRGNESEKPEITISYDNNDVKNEKYFSADREATITIKEQNFAPEKVKLSFKYNGKEYSGTLQEIAKEEKLKNVIEVDDSNSRIWKDSVNVNANGVEYYTDERTNTATVKFVGDGHYSDISISCEDNAGNDNKDENNKPIVETNVDEKAASEFIIDTKAPEVTISYDNNDVENDKYFSSARVATIEVEEENFSSENVELVFKYNGKSIRGTLEDLFADDSLKDIIEIFKNDNEEIWTSNKSEKSLYTAVIKLKKDGDYSDISIECTDKAGNDNKDDENGKYKVECDETVKAPFDFIIDTENPVIESVKYFKIGETEEENIELTAEELSKIKKDGYFSDSGIKAVITIKEQNFTSRDCSDTYTYGLNLDVDAKDYYDGGIDGSYSYKWNNSSTGLHVLTVYFNKDANYKYTLDYIDLAGRKLEIPNDSPDYYNVLPDEIGNKLTVDTLPPTAMIKISKWEDQSWYEVVEDITFGLFSKDKETVTIFDDKDTTSGVKVVSYLKSHDAMTTTELDNTYKDSKWTVGTSLSISPDEQCIVYGRIEDNSGNYAYISTNRFVLDNKEPEIKISYKGSDGNDICIDINVEDPDPTGNGDYAGLKSVTYEVRNNENEATILSGTLEIEEKRQKSAHCQIKIGDSKNSGNSVQIDVEAIDNAGNAKNETFNVDTKSPQVAISYDNNDVKNEKYFSAARKATITVKEQNFAPEKVKLSFKYNGKKHEDTLQSIADNDELKDIIKIEKSKNGEIWTDSEADKDEASYTDERTNTATVKFVGDGYYSDINISCEDKAGNDNKDEDDKPIVKTNVDEKATSEFIIDTKAPVITISYGEEVAENGIYFSSAREATIEVKERNFDFHKVWVSFTLEDDSKFSDTLENLKTEEKLKGVIEIGESWSDSQTGENEALYTDDRTNTAVIKFVGDNHYKSISIYCKDKADNDNKDENDNCIIVSEETKQPFNFVIDTRDPIIDIKYYIDGKEISPGRIEDARLYSNKTIDAVVTITEHNFALEKGFADGQIAYEVAYTKNSADIPDYKTQAIEGEWTCESPDVRDSNNFVFSVDANYTTNFTYTDLAGRSATWGYDYFTVDRTPPTGSIKLADKNVVETFIDIITFHKNPYLFSQTPVKVEMEGSDATSPVRCIEYYKAYEPMTKEQLGKVKWTKVNGNKERYSVEAEYSVGANEQFVPYLRVTDFAGNYDYFSSDTFTFVDNQSPLNEDSGRPIVTITASEPSHGIYNDNVPFHIHAEDPVVGDTYSGLQSVRYEVLTDDKVTQSNTYNFNANDRQRTMDKDEVVTASINNSNNVKIRVTAIDNAGNEVTEIKEIKIDITKPVINITFDNNSPLNDKYYKDTRTATVTVTERNFDESAFQFTITNTDGAQPTISGWSHSANSGVSDDATHTCTISFSADGDYNMSAVCTDLASNISDSVNVEEFTVDKTIPEITVTYDVTSGSTNGYFNQQRLATIRINEHNFNAADVQTKIEAMLEGVAISAPSIVGWSHEGDYHTATVLYDDDGDYTFDISYSDLAGNASNTYAQDVFTIDTTDPEVDIEMPKDSNGENKTAYGNEEVAPRIICADINQDLNAITVSLINMRNPDEKVDTPYTISGSDKEQIIVFQDFEHIKDMDGLYVLKVATTDKAGNVTEEELTFSVNRFGAYYILSDETRDLVSNYYTNEEQEVVITEYNLSKINSADSKVYYTRDGETVNLSQSDDYERTEVTNQGWNEYKYVIDAANFKAEGYYDVAIESEDVTGNKMTNKLNKYTDDDNKYNAEINFIIDKTNPSITINGLDEETYNEISHEATVITTDNIAVWSVDVYIIEEGKLTDDSIEATVNVAYHFDNKARKDDGNTVEGEISALHGELPIVINEANDHQIIKAVALDAAGNVMSSEDYRVLVTSNVFVQFYNNTPVLITSIVILLCIMAGTIILLAKRKKKEDK